MPYKLIANGFMNQCSGNSRINTTANAMTTFRSPICFFNALNGIGNKMSRCPVLSTTANIHKKIIDDFFPFNRMIYFRMKLYPYKGNDRTYSDFLNAATGILSVVANNSKPSGNSFMVSLWLIQPGFVQIHFSNNTSSFFNCKMARPYSRLSLFSTSPPKRLAVNWAP